jgi:hypothetical protein
VKSELRNPLDLNVVIHVSSKNWHIHNCWTVHPSWQVPCDDNLLRNYFVVNSRHVNVTSSQSESTRHKLHQQSSHHSPFKDSSLRHFQHRPRPVGLVHTFHLQHTQERMSYRVLSFILQHHFQLKSN